MSSAETAAAGVTSSKAAAAETGAGVAASAASMLREKGLRRHDQSGSQQKRAESGASGLRINYDERE